MQMKFGKFTFRTTHVKPHNIEEREFATIISIADTTSANDVIHFCHPTKQVHQNFTESSFDKSYLKKFNTLMEEGVFATLSRPKATSYRIYVA